MRKNKAFVKTFARYFIEILKREKFVFKKFNRTKSIKIMNDKILNDFVLKSLVENTSILRFFLFSKFNLTNSILSKLKLQKSNFSTRMSFIFCIETTKKLIKKIEYTCVCFLCKFDFVEYFRNDLKEKIYEAKMTKLKRNIKRKMIQKFQANYFDDILKKAKKLILKKAKKIINQKQKFQRIKTIKEKIRAKIIKKYINQ